MIIKSFIIHILSQYKLQLYGASLFVGGLLVGSLFITFDPIPTHEDKNELAIDINDRGISESARTKFKDRVTNNDSTKKQQINNIAGDADIAPQDAGTFANEAALTNPTDGGFSKEIRIKRGEGLMDILMNNGASRQDAFNAIKALRTVFNVRKIQVGQKLNITHKTSGDLDRLEIQKDFDNLIVIENNANIFEAKLQTLETQTITKHTTGIIDNSLFLAAQKQGLPQSVIIELIRIFSYDVDFQREIRKGDQFEILYKRKLSEDGQQVQEGNILFAKLTLSGKDISLYRHKPNGEDFADYFHEDGQSSKRALMKTPIEGARLSSNYGQRKHPVLGYTRMHKGVDFSAPTGTPIMAAGDGIVERASWYGSFGNYVRIRHNGTYKTIYAHMSKYGKGIKQGTRVRQGQIIGYVGATGRVTGRHLHYEVYMNGTQVNPLSLKIPSGIKLAGRPFEDYKVAMRDMDQKITQAKSHILLVNTEIASISDNMVENAP